MKRCLHLAACALGIALSLAAAAAETDFVIGPDYADSPETKAKDGVPKGELREFTMKSEDSRIYKGIAKGQKGKAPYQRKVAVYIPAQLDKKKPAPFIIAQDGLGYRGVLPVVLDNLIHEKRVPAMVAILINSGGGDAQGSQRGLEYDTVSDVYAKFVEKEVLPKIEKEFDLKYV